MDSEGLKFKPRHRFIIFAWNELGEGGYILPMDGDGYAYLEAIKVVFGKDISSGK